MIEKIRPFNPVKDCEEVVPGLVININEALRTGVVLDTGMEVEYNNIDDPDLIRGRVEDTFQAIDERNVVIGKELKKMKSSKSLKESTGDLPD